MKNPLALLSTSLALALVSPVLRADAPQFTHELKPALLNARDADERTAAARFKFGARSDFAVPTVSAAWFADTEGVFALKSRANPEPITAQLGAEVFKRFGGTVALDLNQPLNPNAPPPPIAPASAGTHDYLVGAGLKVGFESDQRFDNSLFTVGPRLSFTHTENSGFWPLLPSLAVAYQHVRAVRASQLQSFGIPERTFWRLDVAASWKWRPFERAGAAPDSALAPIGVHADVRYFQAYSLPAKAQALGQEEAFYTAGTVSYGTDRLGWKYVHDIFVTVAHGRIPPATREDTTFYLGFTLLK